MLPFHLGLGHEVAKDQQAGQETQGYCERKGSHKSFPQGGDHGELFNEVLEEGDLILQGAQGFGLYEDYHWHEAPKNEENHKVTHEFKHRLPLRAHTKATP